jgi:hypothetical protein
MGDTPNHPHSIWVVQAPLEKQSSHPASWWYSHLIQQFASLNTYKALNLNETSHLMWSTLLQRGEEPIHCCSLVHSLTSNSIHDYETHSILPYSNWLRTRWYKRQPHSRLHRKVNCSRGQGGTSNNLREEDIPDP